MVIMALVSMADEDANLKQMVACSESQDALGTVCDVFGKESMACHATWNEHKHAGCSLGEEEVALGEAEETTKAKAGCNVINVMDTQTLKVCNAAKRLCNVPNKDYCTTSVHVDCMKTIGTMCSKTSPTPPPRATPPPAQHGGKGGQ